MTHLLVSKREKLSNSSPMLIFCIALAVVCVFLAGQILAPYLALTSFSKSDIASPFRSASPHDVALNITLTNPNSTGAEFGSSVAVEPGFVVVGAAGNTGASVYIFNATTGGLICSLKGPTGSEFGHSIAASGNFVVVGSPNGTVNGFADAGKVYIYNVMTCDLIAALNSPKPQQSQFFGSSVAATGTWVVIGAFGSRGIGNVYVFNAKNDVLTRTLKSPNPQEGGAFGWSVALYDRVIVVGAPLENASGGSGAGIVYAFNVKTGALLYTLSDPEPQTQEEFGYSVAADVPVIVVGAPMQGNDGEAFTFNITSGALMAVLTSPNAEYGCDYGVCFGASVSVKGNLAIVGAPGDSNDGGITHPGLVYRFNATKGVNLQTLTDPECSPGVCLTHHGFGSSVASSSKMHGASPIVVGAPYDYESQPPGDQVGLAYEEFTIV